jgi:hypothetical protein
VGDAGDARDIGHGRRAAARSAVDALRHPDPPLLAITRRIRHGRVVRSRPGQQPAVLAVAGRGEAERGVQPEQERDGWSRHHDHEAHPADHLLLAQWLMAVANST